MIPRRLRRSIAPRASMWVIECDMPITAEQAHQIKQAWKVARAARLPLPLILGPGLHVKEVRP